MIEAYALWSTVLVVGTTILQSTFLKDVAFLGVRPDFSLIIIIFLALKNGPVNGQVQGFISGMVDDFTSLSPPGFHAFLKTVIGFLFGSFSGSFFVDPVLVPMLVVAIGTVIKIVIASIIGAVFSLEFGSFALFSLNTFFLILFNVIIAPILFLILNTCKFLQKSRKSEV